MPLTSSSGKHCEKTLLKLWAVLVVLSLVNQFGPIVFSLLLYIHGKIIKLGKLLQWFSTKAIHKAIDHPSPSNTKCPERFYSKKGRNLSYSSVVIFKCRCKCLWSIHCNMNNISNLRAWNYSKQKANRSYWFNVIYQEMGTLKQIQTSWLTQHTNLEHQKGISVPRSLCRTFMDETYQPLHNPIIIEPWACGIRSICWSGDLSYLQETKTAINFWNLCHHELYFESRISIIEKL